MCYIMPKRTTKQNKGMIILAAALALVIALCGYGCSAQDTSESDGTESETATGGDETGSQAAGSASGNDAMSESADNEAADTAKTTDTTASTSSSSAESSASVSTSMQDRAQSILDAMTLEEKVAQLFVITPEQLTGVDEAVQAGDTTKEALETYPVGGLIYFDQNLQNEDQTKEMLANTQSYAKYGMFLSVDEEGGPVVSRIANNAGFSVEQFPAMQTIGESGDVQEAFRVGTTIGSYLSDLGFNMDFAPDADVLTNPDNQVIGSRSFGSDAQVDADMVAQVVQGLQQNNVLAVPKHFPGHGDTQGDSHEDAVENNRTLDELESTEFLPFEAGIEAGAQCVMVGHISLPQVTDDGLPATLSHDIVTGILRDRLGFDGLVITDSMRMGAIANYYSSADAAVKALDAGCDILLTPENFQEAYLGVIDAVNNGTLTEERINESVQRILLCKLSCGIL